MNISYSLYLTLSNLRKRKLRSFLTIGGMAVGVGLVVFLVSLGFGLQKLIKSRITNVEALSVLDVSRGESTFLELNEETVDQFKTYEGVSDVSPSMSLSGQLTTGEAATDVAVYGVRPAFLRLEGIKVTSGNDISSDDAKEVIATTTALRLIGFADPADALGKPLTLKIAVPEQLEGTQEQTLVAKEVEVTLAGIVNEEELTIVYAPLVMLQSVGVTADYSTAKVKVGERGKDFDIAKIKVEDKAKLPEVRKQIESMGYQVDSVADTVGQVDKIFVVFQFVLGGFGAIAMFVAAIGALNTLTVSLLERTREIGLMKTLGATSGDIYRLFLIESVTMSFFGGLLGVAFGYALGIAGNAGLHYLARRVGGEALDIFSTPWLFAIIIIVTSLFVGLFTGYYPARRAGKINPLDALRYE